MPDISLHPESELEYDSAVDWYRARNPVAADNFVGEIKRHLLQMRDNPARHGWCDGDCRECILAKYPYSTIYREEPSGDVSVIAIAHGSRKPGYRKSRL